MPHMVIYRSADGSPGYHQTESLEDAVRRVEQLRNEGEVADTRIFRMEEVPIEIKTYYRVEVHAAAPEVPADPPAPVEPVAVAAEPVAPVEALAANPSDANAAPPSGPEPAAVGGANGGGRFGLFGKN